VTVSGIGAATVIQISVIPDKLRLYHRLHRKAHVADACDSKKSRQHEDCSLASRQHEDIIIAALHQRRSSRRSNFLVIVIQQNHLAVFVFLV